MEKLGFIRSTPAETGTPGYDPRDLMKLYIYGYFYAVRSSRKLARECHCNIEVMWLLCSITDMASEVKKDYEVDVLETVADKGYESPEDHANALASGIIPNVIQRNGGSTETVNSNTWNTTSLTTRLTALNLRT